jgi:diguanylate cyclase (GGDEF)-like protein
MVRLTRKVFTDLAIWMIGLGLATGVVFPFFVVLMGAPPEMAMTLWFFAACMTAGFLVGGVNIWLARTTVGNKMRTLVDHMRLVEKNLRQMTRNGDPERCTPEKCSIAVDSDDEIGECGKAFNYLIEALSVSLKNDAAVRKFNEKLTSHLELELLAGQTLQQLLLNTDAAAGAILIVEEGALNVLASQGIHTPTRMIDSDHVRKVMQTEKRVSLVVPEDLAVEGVLTDFRPREVLIDPLLYKGVILGALILASSTGFTDEVKSRLDLFGQSMALAFNNALTHSRLQQLAAVDPLTSVYNRRFGMSRLREEFSRAVRMTYPLGVMMFDVDNFKKVNDTYGHLVGDRVLMQVTKTALKVLREGDVIIRYGGDEFLVILPAASKENAYDVGERLRRMVEEKAVREGDQMIRFTVSAGMTSYPELQVESVQDLIKRADEALYSAKESGRNQVISA